jgi:hypothetical protein
LTSESTALSSTSPEREIPSPNIISNSTFRNGGAILFLTTFTLVLLPIISSPCLMSQALRKLTATISKTKCTVIFINQIRRKIGVMFGNPETTTGGNALKFYSSVRLDIRRIGAIKNGEDIIGNRTRVKVVKNKIAPPFLIAPILLISKRTEE